MRQDPRKLVSGAIRVEPAEPNSRNALITGRHHSRKFFVERNDVPNLIHALCLAYDLEIPPGLSETLDANHIPSSGAAKLEASKFDCHRHGELEAEITSLRASLTQTLASLALADDSLVRAIAQPVAMILTCPACDARHLDVGKWATKPHHTHACQACGVVWRPAVANTVGVQFLPGFKNT